MTTFYVKGSSTVWIWKHTRIVILTATTGDFVQTVQYVSRALYPGCFSQWSHALKVAQIIRTAACGVAVVKHRWTQQGSISSVSQYIPEVCWVTWGSCQQNRGNNINQKEPDVQRRKCRGWSAACLAVLCDCQLWGCFTSCQEAATLLQKVIFTLNHFKLWQTAAWGTSTVAGAKDVRGTWPFHSGFATGEQLLCQHTLQEWQCKHWVLCSSLNNA